MYEKIGNDKDGYEYIGTLNLSKNDMDLFKKIYIAYSNCFYMDEIKNTHLWAMNLELKSLSMRHSIKFSARLNLLGLIFGPLYYLYRGLFIKSILLALIAAGLYYFQITRMLVPLVWVYCALNIEIDFFVKKFLHSKIVVENPDSLNQNYSQKDYRRFLTTDPLIRFLVLFLVILITTICSYVTWEKISLIFSEKYFYNIEKVCDGRSQCLGLSEKLQSQIGDDIEIADHKALYKLGCTRYELNDKQGAYKYLNAALQANSSSVKYLSAAALAASEAGKHKDAIEIYKYILQAYPQMNFVHYYLGKAYYKAKSYRSALAEFEKATELYPNQPEYYEAKAYTKIYLKDKGGAIEDIKKAIRLLELENKSENTSRIQGLKRYLNLI